MARGKLAGGAGAVCDPYGRTRSGAGCRPHGVPSAAATKIVHLPPVASLFAAFLGYNPIQKLLGPPLLYHLVIDSTAIRLETCVEVIALAAKDRAATGVPLDV